MCEKIPFNIENMISDQQQKFDDLFAEIKYLNHEQWNALDDPCLMTQENLIPATSSKATQSHKPTSPTVLRPIL